MQKAILLRAISGQDQVFHRTRGANVIQREQETHAVGISRQNHSQGYVNRVFDFTQPNSAAHILGIDPLA